MRDPSPRIRSVPRAAATALGVLALATFVGCNRADHTPSPRPSAEPAPFIGPDTRVHPPGELARAADYTMSVETIRECQMEGPFSPKHGHAKVAVELVIEGTTSREVPSNPFYATFRDGSGADHRSTLAGCEPALPTVRVKQGEKTRGFVTFEIPDTLHKLELRYAPLVIGPGVEELKFDVEW